MATFQLATKTFYQVRLECSMAGSVDTLMYIDVVGPVVSLTFGATKGAEVRVGRIATSADDDHKVPEPSGDVEEFGVRGTYTRASAYYPSMTPSAKVLRRHSGDTLVLCDVLSAADALAGGSFAHHLVRSVDVFVGEKRLGGSSHSSLARGRGLSVGLLARTWVHEVVGRIKSAPPVKVTPFDEGAARRIAPLGSTPEGFPSEALAGEAPFGRFTLPVESRPPHGLGHVVQDAQFSAQISPLPDTRHALAYGVLDGALKRRISPGVQNILLVVGSSPGTVSKGMTGFAAAGGRVIGVLEHGNCAMRDTVILPEGITYGVDLLPYVADYLGKSADGMQVHLALFLNPSGEYWSERGELKMGLVNARRMQEATAFVSTVGRDRVPWVFVMMTEADVVMPAWVTSAFTLANACLAVPQWLVGCTASASGVEVGAPFVAPEFDDDRRLVMWSMAALRGSIIPDGGYEDYAAQYPARLELGGTGLASYGRHMDNAAPNTGAQSYLMPGEYAAIAARFDVLVASCKDFEQQHGVVTTGGTALVVPVVYHGSLLANKYLREPLGAPLPTQSAKRVTPLSALVALLDDELYHLSRVAVYLMRQVGSPLHTYELCLRIAALATMTRVDAVLKLSSFAAEATEVAFGHRTPKQRPKPADLKAWAEPLMEFKATYVTKASWALIAEAYKRGNDAASSGKKKNAGQAQTGVGTGEGQTQNAALDQAVAAFANPTPPQGGGGGGGRGRGTGRGRGRGRLAPGRGF